MEIWEHDNFNVLRLGNLVYTYLRCLLTAVKKLKSNNFLVKSVSLKIGYVNTYMCIGCVLPTQIHA